MRGWRWVVRGPTGVTGCDSDGVTLGIPCGCGEEAPAPGRGGPGGVEGGSTVSSA